MKTLIERIEQFSTPGTTIISPCGGIGLHRKLKIFRPL